MTQAGIGTRHYAPCLRAWILFLALDMANCASHFVCFNLFVGKMFGLPHELNNTEKMTTSI